MRPRDLHLALLGLAGVLFFVATDARWGVGLWLDRAAESNVVDAARYGQWGTYAGLVGSLAVMAVGLWLAGRERAR